MYLLFSALCLVLAGCGSGEADKTAARSMVTGLLDDIQAGRIDAALDRYSDAFFVAIPRQEWKTRLETLGQEVGPMERYLLRNEQADTRFSGKFYIFEYESIHARGKLEHLITVVWPVDKDSLQLTAHRITLR